MNRLHMCKLSQYSKMLITQQQLSLYLNIATCIHQGFEKIFLEKAFFRCLGFL